VVQRDWERNDFELRRDAWVWTDDGEIRGFGALYPGGWGTVVAYDDQLQEAVLDRVIDHSVELGNAQMRLMVPATQLALLEAVRARGFREECRFSTYRGKPDPLDAVTTAVEVRSVTGEPDERTIFDLAARSYGDGPDFSTWRQWITTWEYDPSLWLLATEHRRNVGGLVAFTFPSEGWIKRLAVADAEDPEGVGVALVQRAMQTFYERGVRAVGLPVASDEPDYLHTVARAFSLRHDDERILFASRRANF